MFNHLLNLPAPVEQSLYALLRWLHMVCTTLVVGGTLFYEFVIPRAIADLKEETQLAVLGRVRWFFRQVVIIATVILLLTGTLTTYLYEPMYRGQFHVAVPWLVMHMVLGVLTLAIGIFAMARTRAPRHPLTWLRINFIILLIAMFLGSVARQVRLSIQDNIEQNHINFFPTDSSSPAQ